MRPVTDERGMSLVELLIVLLIMVLSLGGVALSFRSSGRDAVRSAAYRLAASMRYARQRAISSGDLLRFHIDLENQQYSLQKQDPLPLDANVGSDPWAVQPPGFEQVSTMRPVRFRTNNERVRWVQHEQTGPGLLQTGAVDIAFYPSGRADAARVCLQHPRRPEIAFSVQVEPISGRVTLVGDCNETSFPTP